MARGVDTGKYPGRQVNRAAFLASGHPAAVSAQLIGEPGGWEKRKREEAAAGIGTYVAPSKRGTD